MFVQHTSEHAVTQISTKTGKVTRKYEGHTGRINVLKFSLHHMYTGSDDSTLRRWNLKRGTCSTVFKGHKDKVRVGWREEEWLINNDNAGALDSIGFADDVLGLDGHLVLWLGDSTQRRRDR